MPEPLKLPAIDIIQGERFTAVWQFTSAYPAQNSPIDMSTWTGTFIIADDLQSKALLTVTPALAITGDIVVTLTAEQTAALTPARQIGGRAAAVFQITLRAPASDFDQVWQGAVSIAARV